MSSAHKVGTGRGGHSPKNVPATNTTPQPSRSTAATTSAKSTSKPTPVSAFSPTPRAVNVALPSVAVLPDALEQSHLAPLREWLKRFWLRGQELPPQPEVDRMTDLATALCIENYTAQFRSAVLHVHEGAFKVLATAAHRNWRWEDDIVNGGAENGRGGFSGDSGGGGGGGGDGHMYAAATDGSDSKHDHNHSPERRLLASARRDYVEGIRRLGVVTQICAFYDGNHPPRDSLAVALVARLKHHLLEKDKAVAAGLRRVLGDPADAGAAVAWAECFPEPNAKPLRVQASHANVAYDSAGSRHWAKKPPPPQAVVSPLSSPTARGKAGTKNTAFGRPTSSPLKPSDAVVVSSGGGTLVTTTETKSVCLPLLPGPVPAVTVEECEGDDVAGGGDGVGGGSVGSGGGGGAGSTGDHHQLTGADRAHLRLAGAELTLGETVTP
jgi:hypothetical protein